MSSSEISRSNKHLLWIESMFMLDLFQVTANAVPCSVVTHELQSHSQQSMHTESESEWQSAKFSQLT